MLLADGSRVLWISTIGPSEECMVSVSTQKVLLIREEIG